MKRISKRAVSVSNWKVDNIFDTIIPGTGAYEHKVSIPGAIKIRLFDKLIKWKQNFLSFNLSFLVSFVKLKLNIDGGESLRTVFFLVKQKVAQNVVKIFFS